MKKLLPVLVALTLVLATLPVMVHATESSLTIVAEADTYVDSTQPTTKYDYTTSGKPLLIIGGNRHAYFRFDLTQIPAGTAVKTAGLRLSRYWTTGTINYTLNYISDDSWNETTMTYNTRPTATDVKICDTTAYTLGTNATTPAQISVKTQDITPTVRAEALRDSKLSIHMTGTTAASFISREYTASNAGTLQSGFSSDTDTAGKLPALVLTLTDDPDEVAVIKDHTALDLGDLSAVTSDIALPTTGPYGSSISWTSSNEQIISTTGHVTRPTDSSQTVTLTATVASGTYSLTKTFTALVKANLSDADSITADLNAITLNYNGTDLTISLPRTGFNDSTITWQSDDPAIDANTGKVTRPPLTDKTVTLTATGTKGTAAPQSRTFTVTVKALGFITSEADAHVQDIAPTTNFGGTPTLIIGRGRTTFIRFDLSPIQGTVSSATLKLTRVFGSNNNVNDAYFVADDSWSEGTITYNNMPKAEYLIKSGCGNNPISIDLTTEVQRELAGDKKLSIMINSPTSTYANEYGSKEYSDIAKWPQLTFTTTTDPDLIDVINQKAALSVTDTRGAASLNLPTGENGVTITWTSANTAVVSNNGDIVGRPAKFASPVQVKLTATLTKNAQSQSRDVYVTILPQSPGYTVESGIISNGVVTQLNITKDIGSANAGKLFIAAYKSGKLVKAGLFDVNSTGTVDANLALPSGYTAVKAFIFDNNLNPLSVVKTLQ